MIIFLVASLDNNFCCVDDSRNGSTHKHIPSMLCTSHTIGLVKFLGLFSLLETEEKNALRKIITLGLSDCNAIYN